eukprot:5616795-Amphidinium_carterae.1
MRRTLDEVGARHTLHAKTRVAKYCSSLFLCYVDYFWGLKRYDVVFQNTFSQANKLKASIFEICTRRHIGCHPPLVEGGRARVCARVRACLPTCSFLLRRQAAKESMVIVSKQRAQLNIRDK